MNGKTNTCVFDDTHHTPSIYLPFGVGLPSYANGGTTLSMAKKGSGVSAILDPCIKKFKTTKAYYDVCKENGVENDCYQNEHFPGGGRRLSQKKPPYETPTSLLTTTCEEGYCPCM